MPSASERAAIDRVAMRLSHRFTDLDTRLVARVVWETYRHFDDHPSREVVPLSVQSDVMFVPTMTDPESDDERALGVQVRVLLE